MTSEPTVAFDPDVEEVLREVVADPNSSLLKVSKRELRSIAPSSEFAASPRSAGWTVSERMLLETYAFQVSKLLKDACRQKLIADSERTHFYDFSNTGEVAPKVVPVELQERSEKLLDCEFRPELVTEASNLLSILAGRDGRNPTIEELAMLSMRLHPTESATVYRAAHYRLSDAHDEACAHVHSVLNGPGSASAKWSAWTTYAFSMMMRGDREAAYDSYTQSLLIRPEELVGAMSRVILAILLENHSLTDEACRHVDEVIPPDCEAIRSFSESQRKLLSRRRVVTNQHARFASSLSGLGLASRRIANVFL